MTGEGSTSGTNSDRRVAKGDGFHFESPTARPDQIIAYREICHRVLALVSGDYLQQVIAELMLHGNEDSAITSLIRGAISKISEVRRQRNRDTQLGIMVRPNSLFEGLTVGMMQDGHADDVIESAYRSAIAGIPTIRERVEWATEIVLD